MRFEITVFLIPMISKASIGTGESKIAHLSKISLSADLSDSSNFPTNFSSIFSKYGDGSSSNSSGLNFSANFAKISKA